MDWDPLYKAPLLRRAVSAMYRGPGPHYIVGGSTFGTFEKIAMQDGEVASFGKMGFYCPYTWAAFDYAGRNQLPEWTDEEQLRTLLLDKQTPMGIYVRSIKIYAPSEQGESTLLKHVVRAYRAERKRRKATYKKMFEGRWKGDLADQHIDAILSFAVDKYNGSWWHSYFFARLWPFIVRWKEGSFPKDTPLFPPSEEKRVEMPERAAEQRIIKSIVLRNKDGQPLPEMYWIDEHKYRDYYLSVLASRKQARDMLRNALLYEVGQ